MSDRNDTKLVSDVLMMARWRRCELRGVIVHSDQGSTYASGDYRKLLKENNLLCNMSHKSECLTMLWQKFSLVLLKAELLDHEDYRTRVEAKQSLFEYIEVFYNRQRRHSYLDYVSPVEYERARAL